MRLIDADAVLQYLQEKLAMFDSVDGKMGMVPTTIRNDLQGFVETILEQPTIPATRWVRCEDEMPDLLQFVLVCNDEGKCVVAQYVGYQMDSLTPWRIAYTMYDTDIYDEKECGPVTHWMPIEPPREGE